MSGDLVAFLRARLDEDEDGATRNQYAPGTQPFREVEAKRAILADYERISQSVSMYPNKGNAASFIAMQTTVKILAAVYSDHPDYRPEWRP